MTKDLEYVYAEIKHHLDNVFADETITTIIQMLKDYPNLKKQLEHSKQDFEVEANNYLNLKQKLEKIKKIVDNPDHWSKLDIQKILQTTKEDEGDLI